MQPNLLPVLGVVLGIAALLAGCAPAPAPTSVQASPPVTVSYPVASEVTDYADFTARTAAVDSVEVRARVWGYLDKINFKEGSLVEKGDVLFEIDPRTYQAAVEQAQALNGMIARYNVGGETANRAGTKPVATTERRSAARPWANRPAATASTTAAAPRKAVGSDSEWKEF